MVLTVREALARAGDPGVEVTVEGVLAVPVKGSPHLASSQDELERLRNSIVVLTDVDPLTRACPLLVGGSFHLIERATVAGTLRTTDQNTFTAELTDVSGIDLAFDAFSEEFQISLREGRVIPDYREAHDQAVVRALLKLTKSYVDGESDILTVALDLLVFASTIGMSAYAPRDLQRLVGCFREIQTAARDMPRPDTWHLCSQQFRDELIRQVAQLEREYGVAARANCETIISELGSARKARDKSDGG